jgi:hypothetical protein
VHVIFLQVLGVQVVSNKDHYLDHSEVKLLKKMRGRRLISDMLGRSVCIDIIGCVCLCLVSVIKSPKQSLETYCFCPVLIMSPRLKVERHIAFGLFLCYYAPL